MRLPFLAALTFASLHTIGATSELTDRFALHAQFTYVEQQTDGFHQSYAGPNSLPARQGSQTADFTLYLGMQPWQGVELWINPEVDQGFGLGNTTGAAGFLSGEAYKVGRATPYLRWQRAFLRQTWDFGTELSEGEAGLNQFAAPHGTDRLVLTIGRFSVADVFDANRLAHDPRSDFLNWSLIDTGSFDYAADAWGYTIGAALEGYHGDWTLRGGLFDLSDGPNSTRLERGTDEYQFITEIEHRHRFGERAGKLALTGFRSHARMALLADAVAWGVAHGSAPDPVPVRALRERHGVAFNAEQELLPGLGTFLRAGASSGNVESYDFTDIDRTLALGLAVDGSLWSRKGDSVGLATVVNRISAARQRYLAAGGIAILVGDGRLTSPGAEHIVEAYYRLPLLACCALTLDAQRVTNPGYNRERGPATAAALRLHAEF
jgi:high affinity Mn2+ porin